MKKSKICKLCNSSYVEDSACCKGYCRECSKFHIKKQNKNTKTKLKGGNTS